VIQREGEPLPAPSTSWSSALWRLPRAFLFDNWPSPHGILALTISREAAII